MTSPKQPPLPEGFLRWPSDRSVTQTAQQLANESLTSLPMGGHATTIDEDGQVIAAFKEYHFDNHPNPYQEPFWHPGVSMLIKVLTKNGVTAERAGIGLGALLLALGGIGAYMFRKVTRIG